MTEINQVLSIEPGNIYYYNTKGVFHILLQEFTQAIVAFDKAIELSPKGYYKPKTNKASALVSLEMLDEALLVAKAVIEDINQETSITEEYNFDQKFAKTIIQQVSEKKTSDKFSDDTILIKLADKILNSVILSREQVLSESKGKATKIADEIQKGLNRRVRMAGNAWSNSYVALMAEFLVHYPPEISFIAVINLREEYNEKYFKEYSHCINAILYIMAHGRDVMRRDACRFFIYFLLGTLEPETIRRNYRESIMGITAVGSNGFKNLDHYMREEIERLNPELIRLIADQPPLSYQEVEWARNITMARFNLGVDRDPEPQKTANRDGFIRRFFKKRSISRKQIF